MKYTKDESKPTEDYRQPDDQDDDPRDAEFNACTKATWPEKVVLIAIVLLAIFVAVTSIYH